MVSTTMPASNWDLGPGVIWSPLCCSFIWKQKCIKTQTLHNKEWSSSMNQPPHFFYLTWKTLIIDWLIDWLDDWSLATNLTSWAVCFLKFWFKDNKHDQNDIWLMRLYSNWPGFSYPALLWDQCWVGQTGWGPLSLWVCQCCCLALKTSSTEEGKNRLLSTNLVNTQTRYRNTCLSDWPQGGRLTQRNPNHTISFKGQGNKA